MIPVLNTPLGCFEIGRSKPVNEPGQSVHLSTDADREEFLLDILNQTLTDPEDFWSTFDEPDRIHFPGSIPVSLKVIGYDSKPLIHFPNFDDVWQSIQRSRYSKVVPDSVTGMVIEVEDDT
ncbi:hypothetical protein M422DRAFT_57218, partial [Sphaerobolus stellatus SS14]